MEVSKVEKEVQKKIETVLKDADFEMDMVSGKVNMCLLILIDILFIQTIIKFQN